ncbi:MAG: hypothetical protein WCI72_05280 [archaeon]
MKTEAITRMLDNRANPLETVFLLDAEIGGITSAKWNPGAGQYKVYNHTAVIALPVRGTNRKQEEALQELATLAYWKAQKNGSYQAGEIPLGKNCSSKHHKQGFKEYTERLLAKYSA